MVKAVFFDIDGTLVSFTTHHILQSTIEVVRKIREQGVKVFIATGRPLPFVNNLGEFEYDGIMTVNGAECRLADGTVLRHDPIHKDDIVRLSEYFHKKPFPIAFASNNDIFITMSSEETQKIFELLNIKPPRVAPLEECMNRDIMQIIAFFDINTQKELMDKVLTGCDAQRWHPLFADVIRKGNNKAKGIDVMIRHYGIHLNETMAFGDGGNDIEMLRHAGFGVAMGNARDEVKQAARYVTESADEGGIANALKKFIMIK